MQDIQTECQVEEPAQDFKVTQPIEIPRKEKPSGRLAWIVTAVLGAALIVAVAIIQAAYLRSTGSAPQLPPSHSMSAVSAVSPAELSKSFREVAKAVKPAVVFIENTSTARSDDSVDIFGFPNPNRPRRSSSAGSGVIVTQDGYILTNNHVVENAIRLEVTLSDNRKLPAKVIGADRETDLAVIKIDASGLPVAILGDSDEVEQGDWVLALGSPFGFQQTLTAGIVSATGRELNSSQFSRYIQTDASINPGNSGGPLINLQGEVIGINTMIISERALGGNVGGNVGIGFAIASKTAREIFSQLVRAGKVSRGYLGVQVRELDAATARSLGLEAGAGVLVEDVPDPDMPAGKAGLRSGDVITSFDGKDVKFPRELTNAVASLPVGKSVKVDFLRDGKPQSVLVELAERPTEITARRADPDRQPPAETQPGKLGVIAQTITPQMAQEMKLRLAAGALVVYVKPGSPAQEAGLRHGDVIHRVGRTEVKSAEDLAAASRAIAEGEEIAIQVERNGQMNWIKITIE